MKLPNFSKTFGLQKLLLVSYVWCTVLKALKICIIIQSCIVICFKNANTISNGHCQSIVWWPAAISKILHCRLKQIWCNWHVSITFEPVLGFRKDYPESFWIICLILPPSCQVVNDNRVNALGTRQSGPHFADDTFKMISTNENYCILNQIALQLISKDLINERPSLVEIMIWRRAGDKPFSEPMMV